MAASESSAPVNAARILRLWWPLAASWLLMGAELPMVAAVVARLPAAETNLAAYGSVVFPVALVVEAPIIMLLAASTALSGDWDSYRKVRRFMFSAGLGLTGVHALIAFTPLFDVVAQRLIHAPQAVVEPGRLGLRLLLPWTLSIAYRRFQQGVLIRFERSRPVTLGTAVRLVANAGMLLVGVHATSLPGVAVAAIAVSAGVVAEALFIGWCVQPVLRERVRPSPGRAQPLTRAGFLRFYVPLALTPLMTLLIQPIGAAAMGRMPLALASLAAWPGVHGLIFLTRAAPLAFNEVVVALYGHERGPEALRRFTVALAAAVVGVLAILAWTPLGALWFGAVSGLAPHLVEMSTTALMLAVPMPAWTAFQSLYTGALVHAGGTRPVTEAVSLYLFASVLLLGVGVVMAPCAGILFALASFSLAGLLQTAWLRWRSRDVRLGAEIEPAAG